VIFVFIGENKIRGSLPTEIGKLTNVTAIIFGETIKRKRKYFLK